MSTTGIQLRSSKYQALTYTVPSGGIVSGDLVLLHTYIVGVAYETKDAGEVVALVTQADKILIPKKTGSGEAIAQGARVFYDAGTGKLTGVSGTLCGRCLEAAGANATTVLVAFNGLCAA